MRKEPMPPSPAGIGDPDLSMKTRPVTTFAGFLITGLALLIVSGLASPAIAGEIGLTARVDNNNVTLEDSIQLSLTVNGVMNAPEPQLPPLPDFKVRSSTQSSSTQIINGKRSVAVTYNYQLAPLKTGSLIIKPAILMLAGVAYRSDPITVSVSKPDPNLQATRSPAYVETSISNANPYVNEQVIYTFKLFRRVEAKNFNLKMSYEDNDFRKEDMGDAKTYPRTINGVQYKVHELSTALYPIHSGTVEIPPAILDLDLINLARNSSRRNRFSGFFNDPFFGSRATLVHKTIRSKPIQVQVRPLPKTGKPYNFSNIAGSLTLSADIGKKELKVGDTTTLTVTVKGPGSVKNLSLSLPEMKDRFKIYPDQPESKLTIQGNNLKGEKIFKFALVPLKDGNNILPSIPLPYFDPGTKKYITAQTKPVALTVHPAGDSENLNFTGSSPSQVPGTKNSVQMMGEDILPIHTQLSDFEKSQAPEARYFVFAGATLVPPFIFFLFTAYTRYHRRLKYDTAFVRNRKAFKVAHHKLKSLSGSAESNPKELVKSLSEIFREYIGNKLNLQGKAITSLEVERKLIDCDYPQEQAVSTRALLEKYESLQYAPPGDSRQNNGLIDESLSLLNQLEKQA